MNSMAAVIIIYILGILIGTVGFGAWKKPGKELTFDGLDYALFTVVALLWPIVAAAAGAVLLVLLVGYGVLYLPIRRLLKIGVWLGEWPERRKEVLEKAEALKDKAKDSQSES